MQPSVPDFSLIQAQEEEKRRNQKRVFDARHAVHDLDPLVPGDEVWVPDHNTTGNVIEPIAPRSYHVSIPTGIVRRNRAHLRRMPNSDSTVTVTRSAESPNCVDEQASDRVTTRSGRVSVLPKRWISQTT